MPIYRPLRGLFFIHSLFILAPNKSKVKGDGETTRNRRSTLFSITIGDDFKFRLVNAFRRCDSIQAFVVAKEQFHGCDLLQDDQSTELRFHTHVFLRFTNEEAKLLPEVRLWILEHLQTDDGDDYTGQLDVQCTRSDRTWIRYITKEDSEPIWRGIDFGLLNVRAQTAYFVRQGERPSASHPLVSNQFNRWRQLTAMWQEMQNQHDQKANAFADNGNTEIIQVPWFRRLSEIVVRTLEEPWFFKRKSIYLIGPADIGKTTAVRSIINSRRLRVFTPSNSINYPFEG